MLTSGVSLEERALKRKEIHGHYVTLFMCQRMMLSLSQCTEIIRGKEIHGHYTTPFTYQMRLLSLRQCPGTIKRKEEAKAIT